MFFSARQLILPQDQCPVLGCMTCVAEGPLAEQLRRQPAKPMGSPRVGSNPTGVVFFLRASCLSLPRSPSHFLCLLQVPARHSTGEYRCCVSTCLPSHSCRCISAVSLAGRLIWRARKTPQLCLVAVFALVPPHRRCAFSVDCVPARDAG